MNPFADIPQSPLSPDSDEGKRGFGLILERYHSRDAKHVVVPDGVTQILPGAFRGHGEIVSVSLPDTLESIGDEAFRDCGALVRVEIPDTVFELGKRAFSGCGELMRAQLPAGLMRIERSTFSLCAKLRRVLGGDEVFLVDDGAFSGCGALVRMPSFPHLEHVGAEAFAGCSSIERIILPDTVKTIGTEAFRNCASLRVAVLPACVRAMGKNVFGGCFSLSHIEGSDELMERFPDAFPRLAVNAAGKLRPQDRRRDERAFAQAHADEMDELLRSIERDREKRDRIARERESLGPLDRAAKRELDAQVARVDARLAAARKQLDELAHPSDERLLEALRCAGRRN